MVKCKLYTTLGGKIIQFSQIAWVLWLCGWELDTHA